MVNHMSIDCKCFLSAIQSLIDDCIHDENYRYLDLLVNYLEQHPFEVGQVFENLNEEVCGSEMVSKDC